MKPRGVCVAILGPDGSGKSTIIEAIKPALDTLSSNDTVVQHLRPGLLPPLARLMRRHGGQEGPVTDPHGSQPSGVLGSSVRVLYLMTDYVLGYWLRVHPKISRSTTIVVFDRYVYDIAIDPRRFRIALPARVIRWLTRVAPKPDLIFCLYGRPEVLAARKQELPVEEVARQVEALVAFAALEPRAILVSTDGTVEEARDQVLRAITEHCSRRPAKAHRGF